jgi:hypothetical protein
MAGKKPIKKFIYQSEPPATAAELTELERVRPRTRKDCADGIRPCPFISCRHHLYADPFKSHRKKGALSPNFDSLEEMPDTCSLDVADRGELSLEQTGAHLNITREAVRLTEAQALHKIRLHDKYCEHGKD